MPPLSACIPALTLCTPSPITHTDLPLRAGPPRLVARLAGPRPPGRPAGGPGGAAAARGGGAGEERGAARGGRRLRPRLRLGSCPWRAATPHASCAPPASSPILSPPPTCPCHPTRPPTRPPPPAQQLEEDQRVMQGEVLRSGDAGINLPVNLRRLIENAQRKFGCKPHKRGPTGACAEEGLGGAVLARSALGCSLFELAARRCCCPVPGGALALPTNTAFHLLPTPNPYPPARPGPAGRGAARAGAVPEADGARGT